MNQKIKDNAKHHLIKKISNMIIEQLRNLFIFGVILAVGVFVSTIYKPSNLICPDSFEDSKKRATEFKKWINNFYENNPDVPTNEVMDFRRDFLAKNSCKKALQTYNFYITTSGKVVEETTKAEGIIKAKEAENQLNPVCPDDFNDPKQEIASFSKWVKEFTEKYPNATSSDLSKARINFYIENNCTEALKRYEDYMAGNIDEETKQLIKMIIKKESDKNKF